MQAIIGQKIDRVDTRRIKTHVTANIGHHPLSAFGGEHILTQLGVAVIQPLERRPLFNLVFERTARGSKALHVRRIRIAHRQPRLQP